MLRFFRPHRVVALVVAVMMAAALHAQSASSPSSSPAGTVPLLRPLGLAYDSQGDLFFAEAGNHRIRRLDPAGNLTTVAGTGLQGFSGDTGPATLAQLDSPAAIALDPAGNLFIADTRNNRIRRVDATSRLISTIAGTGISGFSGDGSPATDAKLASPVALAFDSADLLYIADTRNHRVRCLNLQTGLITSVAGTGAQGFSGDGDLATNAHLDSPSSIVLDANRNLYVADTGNHRIRRVDAVTHIITTVAGASMPSLLRPVSLAATPSSILIADAASNRVLRLDASSGALTVLAGQGSQSFSGDGGSASAAMLNTPTALAIASSGAITIADTGNQRIRQIAIDGSISTVAGLGTPAAGSLLLSGATTQSYGSTTLLAALSTGAQSLGTVSLLDTTAGNTALLAQSTLGSGSARFDLTTLPAGSHLLQATFSGDSTHRAAQSHTLALTIAPIAVTASLNGNSNIVFGQPVPDLNAILSGVLSVDAGRLTTSIVTNASATSPPGTYPISIALSGPAAANYTLSAPSASLTIAKAPVVTTLLQAGTSLTAHVATSTVGIPTGAITLLTSAGTRFSTVLLDAAGTARISTTSLADGDYTLSAIYSGDTDFLSAQSTPLNLTVGTPAVPADFSFSMASSTAQTVNSGETATFTVALKVSGTSSLAGPITLSASALPVGFTANFDPPVIPPGGVVNSFTLSIATPRALASRHPFLARHKSVILACLSPICMLVVTRRRRVLLVSLAAIALCGCGARINSAATAQTTSTAYPITITGTTTQLDGSVLQHTATVTLTVQ